MAPMENNHAYTRCTESVQETKELATTLAPLLCVGDAVLLEGDLGAGKTQFVQAVASGLGVAESVVSPTFNIMIAYQGESLELDHFDLYRLDSEDQLEDIGYWETLEAGGVCFIEWGSKFPGCLPEDHLRVCIECTGPASRKITCSACGPRAQVLLGDWVSQAGSGLA